MAKISPGDNAKVWIGVVILLLLAPARRVYANFWSEARNNCWMSAAYVGNKKALRTLMSLGVTVEDRTPYTQSTAIMIAAGQGHTAIVQWLLTLGVHINAESVLGRTTALMEAAREGHEETVQFLLEAGADISQQDQLDRTAFAIAAGDGHVHVLENLLEAGASFNTAGPQKLTPLRLACVFGQRECVRWLEQHGAVE